MIPRHWRSFNKLHKATMAASPTAPLEDQTEALAATHRLKLRPPTYDGNYSTFEEWKYKFTAYMGLMDPFYPNILRRAATSTQRLTEADLRGAAQNTEEADRWVQLDKVHACERDNRSCSNSV